MKMAPQGAVQTGLVRARTGLVRARTGLVRARTGLVRLRTSLVRLRTSLVCARTGHVRLRTDPVRVSTSPVRAGNEALSGRNDIIEKLKVESWKVEIRGCQKDCVRVIRNADHRIGQKDRGGEDGNLKTETKISSANYAKSHELVLAPRRKERKGCFRISKFPLFPWIELLPGIAFSARITTYSK